MIERKITPYQFRPGSICAERIPMLLEVNRNITDRAHKSAPGGLPMKNLAGVKRLHQIEIRSRELTHRWIAFSERDIKLGGGGAFVLNIGSSRTGIFGEADPPNLATFRLFRYSTLGLRY